MRSKGAVARRRKRPAHGRAGRGRSTGRHCTRRSRRHGSSRCGMHRTWLAGPPLSGRPSRNTFGQYGLRVDRLAGRRVAQPPSSGSANRFGGKRFARLGGRCGFRHPADPTSRDRGSLDRLSGNRRPHGGTPSCRTKQSRRNSSWSSRTARRRRRRGGDFFSDPLGSGNGSRGRGCHGLAGFRFDFGDGAPDRLEFGSYFRITLGLGWRRDTGSLCRRGALSTCRGFFFRGLLIERAKMGADFFSDLVFEGARVRLLVRDAYLRKIVQDGFALDFKLPRELIDPDRFHLFPELPPLSGPPAATGLRTFIYCCGAGEGGLRLTPPASPYSFFDSAGGLPASASPSAGAASDTGTSAAGSSATAAGSSGFCSFAP